MGEVYFEGLGLDCNPLVLVRNNPAQSGTNNVTGTHTHTHTQHFFSLTHSEARLALADVTSS